MQFRGYYRISNSAVCLSLTPSTGKQATHRTKTRTVSRCYQKGALNQLCSAIARRQTESDTIISALFILRLNRVVSSGICARLHGTLRRRRRD